MSSLPVKGSARPSKRNVQTEYLKGRASATLMTPSAPHHVKSHKGRDLPVLRLVPVSDPLAQPLLHGRRPVVGDGRLPRDTHQQELHVRPAVVVPPRLLLGDGEQAVVAEADRGRMHGAALGSAEHAHLLTARARRLEGLGVGGEVGEVAVVVVVRFRARVPDAVAAVHVQVCIFAWKIFDALVR